MDSERLLQPALLSWSAGNALALSAGTLAVAAGLPVWLLSAAGLLSFGLLVYHCRHRWTPSGRFGPANALTFLRLAGILVLPVLAPVQIACLALLLFVMDGLDGWIARRSGLAGEFGEFADKESDALLTLMLCALLYRLPASLGPWILLPGLLRYVFVLFVTLAKPPRSKEVRTAKAGWISAFMLLSLIVCLAAYPAYPQFMRILAGSMTLLLCCSFAESVYRMYAVPRLRGKA